MSRDPGAPFAKARGDAPSENAHRHRPPRRRNVGVGFREDVFDLPDDPDIRRCRCKSDGSTFERLLFAAPRDFTRSTTVRRSANQSTVRLRRFPFRLHGSDPGETDALAPVAGHHFAVGLACGGPGEFVSRRDVSQSSLDREIQRAVSPRSLKPRPRKPADERDTTERLLDTAERLFAEHGFDGIGMRALAEEAGVNLGAATYHYGSKEGLYVEAFMRRFRPTNAERLQLLRDAEAGAGGKPLAVETIVECMVRPPFQTVLKHPNFPALLVRNLFMPPPFMQQAVHKEMVPHVQVFLAALARALPRIPPDLILLREIFTMGTVLISAGQFARLPAQVRANPVFFDYALRELVRYVTAALSAAPAVSAKDRPPVPFSFPPEKR